MTIDHLLSMPCTIHTFTGDVDAWGEPGSTITAAIATVCYFEQTDATEVLAGQETYWADGRVFLPAGTDVDAAAWITVEGAIWEVVGKPATRKRPDESVSHIEANVREVTSS